MISERNRLLKVLKGEQVNRPPVICPGGMMSSATTAVLEEITGSIHEDAESMAKVALAIKENSGFENLGVPFCMTAEAEVLGAEVNLGDAKVEPLVTKYIGFEVKQLLDKPLPDANKAGRLPVITDAIRILKQKEPELPVIGNITGPISLATSLIEPMDFLKDIRRDPNKIHALLIYVSYLLIDFAKAQIEAGADVIAIADPTATGEILGPKSFAFFVTPYLHKLVKEIRETGTPVILHICGDATSIIEEAKAIKANALSFDAMVNMGKAKDKLPDIPLMGNLSTQLLHQGNPERIQAAAKLNQSYGIDIHAPACGISLATPKDNLQAFTSWVRGAANE